MRGKRGYPHSADKLTHDSTHTNNGEHISAPADTSGDTQAHTQTHSEKEEREDERPIKQK